MTSIVSLLLLAFLSLAAGFHLGLPAAPALSRTAQITMKAPYAERLRGPSPRTKGREAARLKREAAAKAAVEAEARAKAKEEAEAAAAAAAEEEPAAE